MDGQVTKAGGASQYLVPNRGLYTEATRVTSLGNDLALHNERVVGKGLGAPIAALSAESNATRGLRGTAVRGLGAAGAAVTAYDAVDTFHDAARLRSQGNATAAQAQIERFATRNVGGWGGAVAGVGAGAMAGVESGPGLLVTGAIGGIVGAVAGDKVADWINDRKINRQEDPRGNTWTFDPDHTEKGWTRTERELDIQAMSATTVEMPIYRTRTLTADSALSDRLTWQASSTAIELALGSPPQSRDPYTLPANAQDAPSLLERNWRYNADRSAWQRVVVDQIHDHGIESTHTETASPHRAAQLDAAAQAIIARNASQTPAAMATQFQAAHERNGWAQHGPLPEAVTDAIRNPGRVVGSDGDLYQRNAQGQWIDDGVVWDSHAKGNLRRELDATWQQQNANLRAPTQMPENIPTLDTVEVRAPREAAYPESEGTSPAQAREATPSAPTAVPGPPQASGPSIPDHLRDFRHPEHPRHPGFHGFMDGLEKVQAGYLQGSRLPENVRPEHFESIAAALTAAQGTQPFFGEVGRVHQDKDGALWVSNLPPNLISEQPRWVKIDLADTLAQTPEAQATRWREQHLPAPARDMAQAQTQSIDPQQLSPTDLRHPDHPRHGMFAQTRGLLATEYERWGLMRDPAQLDRETAQVVVEARKQHMDDVGGVSLSFPQGSTRDRPMVTLLEHPTYEFANRTSVDGDKLAHAPQVDQAGTQLQQVEQHVALMQQQEMQQRQEHEMAQGQGRTV